MKGKILALYFSLFIFHSSFSQGPIMVELSRKICPKTNYGGMMAKSFYHDTMKLILPNGKDSSFIMMDGYQMVAGDFADGKTKFTVAVNTRGGSNQIYLAPYRADSVCVTDSRSGTQAKSLIVVKAWGKEYSATLNKEATEVTLQQLYGHYAKPDVQLYDSLMPDGKFNLFNGGSSTFQSYKHQHKYIYVIFWYGWQPGDTREIDALKNVSDLYKDALTVLSFHSTRADTAVIKQMQKDKNIDWVEAKDSFDAETDFPSGGHVLFNDDGKAIALGVWPQNLKAVIEKLLHVRN